LATEVPVWLRREDSRRTWEEDTWTSTLSRHGAGFVCRHPVEIGGTVVLTRKDKGGRATARVVYSRMDSEGRQIGVEFIDRDDFWD
jgi:PilZ domain-containing protein